MMRLFDSELAISTPLLSSTEPPLHDPQGNSPIMPGTIPQRSKLDQQEQKYSQRGEILHQRESSSPPKGTELHPQPSEKIGEFVAPNPLSRDPMDRYVETAPELLPDADTLSEELKPIPTGGEFEKQRLEEDGASVMTAPPPSSSDEEPDHGFLPVLRNRNFLVMWAGQIFSQLADKVYLVLMIMLISSHFQSPDQSISGWVSSIMVAFTIPAVLFGSVAGVFVDHWSKKGVLVVTNLLRGALVLGIPPLLWLSGGWAAGSAMPIGFVILLGITFLVSTLTQFFAPAEQAAIPLIVERKHLLSANSLYATTMMASIIIGFAVGEPLLAIADSLFNRISYSSPDIGKELLVGVSYAIAGILLSSLQTREKVNHAELPPPHVWDNIRDGLRYLRDHAVVRAALTQLVILFSVFAALAVLAVRLAEVMPAIKASQFGFLLAAGGVGMAIGALIVGHKGQRISRNTLSLCGSLGLGVSLAALSIFTQQLIPTLLVLATLGIFASMVAIPMQTTIQEQTPEEMRGKVFGLQNNATNIALSLPLALAGVAESYLGLNIVFLGLGGLAIAGGIFAWSISRMAVSKTTM